MTQAEVNWIIGLDDGFKVPKIAVMKNNHCDLLSDIEKKGSSQNKKSNRWDEDEQWITLTVNEMIEAGLNIRKSVWVVERTKDRKN
jgi:hypothetical protein